MVPAWLAERFDGLQNDPQTHALVASAVAAEQVLDLVERGVSDFHFYTMNRADLVFAICHMIGIRSHEAGERRESAGGLNFVASIESKRPGKNPAFSKCRLTIGCCSSCRSGGYGRTPMIRAPMNANAAQIINALIGLVSPMS